MREILLHNQHVDDDTKTKKKKTVRSLTFAHLSRLTIVRCRWFIHFCFLKHFKMCDILSFVEYFHFYTFCFQFHSSNIKFNNEKSAFHVSRQELHGKWINVWSGTPLWVLYGYVGSFQLSIDRFEINCSLSLNTIRTNEWMNEWKNTFSRNFPFNGKNILKC